MERLSQNDHRWSRIMLGRSYLTIGSHGCLVTCLAMIAGVTPAVMANSLQFTDPEHKYGAGLIIWNERNLKVLKEEYGLEYVPNSRIRSFTAKDRRDMQTYCKSEEYFPILEVETRVHKRHWLLPVGRALTFRGFGWACENPWNGAREWKTVGWMAPYLWETGWILFKKIKKTTKV